MQCACEIRGLVSFPCQWCCSEIQLETDRCTHKATFGKISACKEKSRQHQQFSFHKTFRLLSGRHSKAFLDKTQKIFLGWIVSSTPGVMSHIKNLKCTAQFCLSSSISPVPFYHDFLQASIFFHDSEEGNFFSLGSCLKFPKHLELQLRKENRLTTKSCALFYESQREKIILWPLFQKHIAVAKH